MYLNKERVDIMNVAEKQVKHRLSEVEKLHFVKEYLSSNMNKAAFANSHNIDRKALGRWVEKYGEVAQKDLDAQLEDSTDASDSNMMVSIHYLDYLELLNTKHKYEVLHAFLHA